MLLAITQYTPHKLYRLSIEFHEVPTDALLRSKILLQFTNPSSRLFDCILIKADKPFLWGVCDEIINIQLILLKYWLHSFGDQQCLKLQTDTICQTDGPLVPMVGLVPVEKDVIPMVLLMNMHLIKGT